MPKYSSTDKMCSFEGCGRRAKGRGLCGGHWLQQNQGKELKPLRSISREPRQKCIFDGCDKLSKTKTPGYCVGHLNQIRKGRELTPLRTKKGWKNSSGYIVIYMPEHPNSSICGTIYQHVLVMSSAIGRPLFEHENVHHKNGNREDNRPENLEIWSTKQPQGQRIEDKLKFANEIIEAYSPVKKLGYWDMW